MVKARVWVSSGQASLAFLLKLTAVRVYPSSAARSFLHSAGVRLFGSEELVGDWAAVDDWAPEETEEEAELPLHPASKQHVAATTTTLRDSRRAGFTDHDGSRTRGCRPCAACPILKNPIFRSAQTSWASVSESQYSFASRSRWARLFGFSGGSGGIVRGTNRALFGISGSRNWLE
jgi:hypothetical protein